MDLSLLLLVFSLNFTVASRFLLLHSTTDKTSRLKMKSFSTMRDAQRGSQSYMEKRRGNKKLKLIILSVQFSSVAQSCLTLCDPMDCSKPGFPVHHQLLELTQTHVHQVGDGIQPSHTLLSPSPPAFNLSQPGFFPKSQFFVSGSQSIRISIDRRK